MTEKEIQERINSMFKIEEDGIRIEEQYDNNFEPLGTFIVSFQGDCISNLTPTALLNLSSLAKMAHDHHAPVPEDSSSAPK